MKQQIQNKHKNEVYFPKTRNVITKYNNHYQSYNLPYSVAVQLLRQVWYYSAATAAFASRTLSTSAWGPNTHPQLSACRRHEISFLPLSSSVHEVQHLVLLYKWIIRNYTCVCKPLWNQHIHHFQQHIHATVFIKANTQNMKNKTDIR